MVTTVGTSQDYRKLLENFLLLEHDAVAAYEATIERLELPQNKEKVEEFLRDHQAHIKELHALASREGAENPNHGDAKEYLTTGKVKIAALVGDDAVVLEAMSTNEIDTITAYENAVNNISIPSEDRPFFEKGLADERRHKEWMDRAAGSA